MNQIGRFEVDRDDRIDFAGGDEFAFRRANSLNLGRRSVSGGEVAAAVHLAWIEKSKHHQIIII